LASIEVTVVATAMPTIVRHLGGWPLYPWVFSAYLLAQTVTIPLYGRLADLYGRRATYAVGVALFLVGSVACGLAPSMGTLVAARLVQGAGAGCVLPLTMTIFADLYDLVTRTKLQGLFSLVWGTSSLAGPLVGGAIALHWSWRWVFLLNLPFGVLSVVIVLATLREPSAHRRHRLDLLGAFLLAAATLLLLVGLLPAEQRPWALSPFWWFASVVAVAASFIIWEQRHPEPLIPLPLLRHRLHLAVNGAGLLLGMVLFGAVSYVPLYVQYVLGGTPLHAGLTLVPLSVGWSTASLLVGRLVQRVGFTALVRGGAVAVALGAALSFVALDVPLVALGGVVFYGLGMGALISCFTVSVQEHASPREKGIVTALAQFSRSIGGAVGVALLGVLATRGGAQSVDHLVPAATGSLATGLHLVFGAMVALAWAAMVVTVLLFPRLPSPRRP
jgi:EmrB/QacA subfamily drug resistance transporter